MRQALIVLALLLLPSVTFAQTRTAQWVAPPEIATPADALTFTWTLYVTPKGTTTTTANVLSSVACSVVNAQIACTAPAPAALPSAYDTKVELTAKTPLGAESAKSVPFILPTSAPVGLGVK